MVDVASLLPPTAAPLERNIEQSATGAMEHLPVPIRDLWNPDTCPAHLLPWLAWALDVAQWQSDWSEAVQRAAIKASWGVHNHMGTAGGLRLALESLGYSQVHITEYVNLFHRGSFAHNGSRTHVGTSLAFQFDVTLNVQRQNPSGVASSHDGLLSHNAMHDYSGVPSVSGTPSASAIASIKQMISAFKNARSHLRNLYYASAWHNGSSKHNGALLRDGGLTLG